MHLKRHLVYLIIFIACSGCSVVSKQYYYVPSTELKVVKDKDGYFNILHVYGQVTDSAGNCIGQVRTSSNLGIPLMTGPAYVPVLPVGLVTVFVRSLHRFEMDLIVKDSSGNFIRLAVDSAAIRSQVNPSKNAYREAFIPVDTGQSYMIINGRKKVPVQIAEVFNMNGNGYGYRIKADVSFEKVRTATIITGNPLLNRELGHIIFTRKKRLSHSVMGFS